MMAWLTRKNETLRKLLEEAKEQKNIAEMKLEYNLKQLGESREVNEKLVKENLQYRSENTELRKANDETTARIEHLEKCMSIYQSTKHTSFQEDLEFFVNECTEAQARELYERLKKRFDNGPYVLCKDGTKALVGDEVQVIISTMDSIRSNTGIIDSILFDSDKCKCVRFDLKVDNGARLRLWTDDNQAVRVFLLARREEKNA